MTTPEQQQPTTEPAEPTAPAQPAETTTRKPRPPRKTGNPRTDREQAAAKPPAKPKRPAKVKTVKLSFGTVEVPDCTGYSDKKPTQTVADYLRWLEAAVGVKFTESEMRAAYLCQSPLRQVYQRIIRDQSPRSRGKS